MGHIECDQPVEELFRNKRYRVYTKMKKYLKHWYEWLRRLS